MARIDWNNDMKIFLLAMVMASTLMTTAALAQPARSATERYNTVELQAEARREIANDLMNATL